MDVEAFKRETEAKFQQARVAETPKIRAKEKLEFLYRAAIGNCGIEEGHLVDCPRRRLGC